MRSSRLNEFYADLIGASPYRADTMALGVLRKQKRECLGKLAREWQADADARDGNVNNLALSQAEAAIQSNPPRRIQVSARRLTSLLTSDPTLLLALPRHLAWRANKIHCNLLVPFPCHATVARRRFGLDGKRKFVGNLKSVFHLDQRASRRDVFDHAQDAAIGAARNDSKLECLLAILASLIGLQEAAAVDKMTW